MTTGEILKSEKNNSGTIHLHPEGMFYKAYEASALLLRKSGVELQPVKKSVKKENCSIVAVGFPIGQLEARMANLKRESDTPAGHPAFRALVTVTDEEVEAWKDELEEQQPKGVKTKAAPSFTENERLVLERLRSFNVASNSPLEAMSFLNELVNLLK